MEAGILLESGTNELEILEFKVGNNYYGINVAKVMEILPYQVPTPVPNSHKDIEGIFMPRNIILSVVDLASNLNIPSSINLKTDMYIVTNFNKLSTAFHVHGVVGIHRVFWSDIMKPDETVSSNGDGVATGIIKLDGKLIIILDFEKIVSEISPETSLKIGDIDKLGVRDRNSNPILVAEDSPMLSRLIHDCLTKAGYTNLTMKNNGEEAWNTLSTYKKEGSIDQKVACVVTDIEMPQMDGHRLTKLIKDDKDLQHIPVIIFSSLINEEMKRKGELIGANAQLSKPEIGLLVQEIDKVVKSLKG